MEANEPLYWTSVIIVFGFILKLLQKLHSKKGNGEYKIPLLQWTPFNLPLLDGVLSYILFRKYGLELFDKVVAKTDGKILKFPLGLKSIYLIWDADVVQKLLKTPLPEYLHKPRSLYGVMFPEYLQNGMLASTYDIWSPHRKAASHAFTFKTLGVYTQYINDCAKEMVEKTMIETNKNEIIKAELLSKHMDHFFLKVLLQVLIGSETSAFSPTEINTFYEYFRIAKETVVDRLLNPLLFVPPIWFVSPQRKQIKKCMDVCDYYSKEVLKRFKRENINKPSVRGRIGDLPLNKSGEFNNKEISKHPEPNNEEENEPEGKPFQCLVERLLVAGLPEKEILDEIATILAVGHETNRIAMDMLIFQLALNPHHQRKCQQEVDQIFACRVGNKDITSRKNFSGDELTNLKYLERCILESLRMAAPVPFFGRLIQAPLEISKDCVLNSGELVVVCPWALHRHPDYFPKPELFDPDRFLAENKKQQHPYSFIPFSSGMRNCIGWKLALTEMKIFMAWILRNFDISTTDNPDDVKILFDITIRLERPYNVTYKRRDL